MTTTTTLTLDDFLEFPETKPAREYVCGEVIRKPMPSYAHFLIQGFLVTLLQQFLERAHLGVAGPELRCTFGSVGRRRSLVPDVAFIAWDRLPPGDARKVAHFDAPPNLAIEVLSPRQSVGRMVDKAHFYLRHGVQMVWIVDPAKETITVLAVDTDPVTLTSGATLDGGEVLPGFCVELSAIFARLLPHPSKASPPSSEEE